jgi:hypothetical protein
MADTSLGFRFRYRECGAPPTIRDFVAKDAETLTKGDLINLESGEADLAASDDAGLVGVCLETKACDGVATTGDTVAVIVDRDAVYGVYDANARVIGAGLDLAGTTGAQTVAADSNHDLIVVANSSAAEETLVKILHGAHVLDTVKV